MKLAIVSPSFFSRLANNKQIINTALTINISTNLKLCNKMADIDHEVGAIRFLVDAPLSSKVAMFNKVVSQHQESQLLNPFSQTDGRKSPRPIFTKEEYGKPTAGSLTEIRGQKANMHVCKEILELCLIIDSEGFPQDNEPELKVILFGDLFNIYTHISDKLVGMLLRARKYKFLDFEGEVLFQRRDDDIPIFMLKPIEQIKIALERKQEEMRRSVSPQPLTTSTIPNISPAIKLADIPQ